MLHILCYIDRFNATPLLNSSRCVYYVYKWIYSKLHIYIYICNNMCITSRNLPTPPRMSTSSLRTLLWVAPILVHLGQNSWIHWGKQRNLYIYHVNIYIYIQLYPQNVIEQYMSYQYVSRVLLFHLCEVCYNNYNIWKPWRNCCQPDGNVLPTIA